MRILLLYIGLLAAASATPAAAGVYEVAGIGVEARAATLADARRQALQQGQTHALEIVLRRLVPQTSWEALPPPDTLDVERLVASLRIHNEKTTRRTYSASVDVDFAPALLRELLVAQELTPSDAQARPALLIPILEDADGVKLWEEHWWRSAWASQDLANAAAPLILPRVDTADTSTPSADILIGHPTALAALNSRYDTNTIIVAHAIDSGAGQLGITLYIFGENESDVVVRNYPNNDEVQAQQAAIELIEILGERWKVQAASLDTSLQTTQVLARFPDLPSWLRLQQAMSSAAPIQNRRLVALSSFNAVLDISHTGDVAALASELARVGLTLAQNPDTTELELSLK